MRCTAYCSRSIRTEPSARRRNGNSCSVYRVQGVAASLTFVGEAVAQFRDRQRALLPERLDDSWPSPVAVIRSR